MAKATTKTTLKDVHSDIKYLKNRIKKVPTHFSFKDIVRGFFGAIILGLTFVFKGQIFRLTEPLTQTHIIFIIISTLLILSFEIYFIGYSRLTKKDKKDRKFLQFWLKRLIAFYAIAIFTSSFLVYIYGVNLITGSLAGTWKIIITVSMPCAIGAAIADLLKKY